MKKLILLLILWGCAAIQITGQPKLAYTYTDAVWSKVSPHIQKVQEKAKATITKYTQGPDLEKGVWDVMETWQTHDGRKKLIKTAEVFGLSDEHSGNLNSIESGFNKHQEALDNLTK